MYAPLRLKFSIVVKFLKKLLICFGGFSIGNLLEFIQLERTVLHFRDLNDPSDDLIEFELPFIAFNWKPLTLWFVFFPESYLLDIYICHFVANALVHLQLVLLSLGREGPTLLVGTGKKYYV